MLNKTVIYVMSKLANTMLNIIV